MRFGIRLALVGACAVAASPAMAADIVSASGVTVQSSINGVNLNNTSMDGTVYLFNEGTVNGVTSYLLHYGRGALLTFQKEFNNGSFGIKLSANEIFGGYVTSTAELKSTDRTGNGATYSKDTFRGLEDPSQIFFVDSLTVGSPNPVNVSFRFDTANNSSDEARFFVRSVPEPATWAMMILGIGMTGCTLRRRKPRVAVTYA